MVGIIFDVIIVAIIALNAYSCYRKGLVNLAVGLIAFVAALILAVILFKPVSNVIIDNTKFDENIESFIVDNFSAQTPDGEQVQVQYVSVWSYLEKYIGEAMGETQNQLVADTAKTLSVKVINLITFIGIFTIVRVALFALTFIADAITSLPILKQIDDVGGILYGLVKALIIVYVALAILFFVVGLTANETISTAIESSFVTKFFYNNNILLNLIF